MTYDLSQLSNNKRNWIARSSNIPRRFWGWEIEDITRDRGSFPQEISEWLAEVYAGDIIRSIGKIGWTGVGLLLDGAPGMGKTTHAVTVLMELIRNLPEDEEAQQAIFRIKPENYGAKFRPVYYLTFNDFLQKKKAIFDSDGEERRELHREIEGFHGRAKDDWLNVRVLVLDDLGKESGTDFDKYSFDDLSRARYDAGLPTIVTTNKMREVWGDQYSDAMSSFSHEAFRRVTLVGDDLREA